MHVLFNNAGIMMSDDDDAVNTTEATMDKTFAVNVKGVLLGCARGAARLGARLTKRGSAPSGGSLLRAR